MDKQMKNLKKTLIIMKVIMVCAALFLIYCVISFFNYKSSMEECTSVMWGVVTDVEKKNNLRHGYDYKAYVTSENNSSMKFESISTKHKYIKGERVKIHYNPDDISDYYIEGASPVGKDISMIITLLTLMIVIFVVHTIKKKQYKLLLTQTNN